MAISQNIDAGVAVTTWLYFTETGPCPFLEQKADVTFSEMLNVRIIQKGHFLEQKATVTDKANDYKMLE